MALEEKATRKYKVSTTKDNTSLGIVEKLRDPAFKSKFLRWMWLPCGMFSMGVVSAQGGPTILDLEIITNQDKEMGSLIITSMSGGYLTGSFAGGAIYGKINNNIILAVVCLLGGAINIATPYCSEFILMLCIRFIVGFFLGVLDCSINAEHMRIWSKEGQALLQFAHFAYAMGGIASPAFSAPFLAEKDEENSTATQRNPSSTTTALYLGNGTAAGIILYGLSQYNSSTSEQPLSSTQIPYFNHTDSQNSTLPRTTEVHYAFLISGSILATTAIPFFAMIFLAKSSTSFDTTQGEEKNRRKLPVSLHLFLTAILCTYYLTYTCIENTFASFLETFLVDRYDSVSKAKAAYITTFYWAAFAVGRFTSVFTSKWFVAVRLLYLQYTLIVVAFTGFYVSAYYANIEAITACTCLIGVSLSAVFPAGLTWTEAEIMKVTGRISGVIFVGSATGAVINPYIMGYLMEHRSNFWFCYFLVGSVGVTLLLFLFLLVFNRLYVNKKYGIVDQRRPQEQINGSSKSAE